MQQTAEIVNLFEDKKLPCAKCGQLKPFSEFNKSNSKKRGFTYRCKDCISLGRRKGKNPLSKSQLDEIGRIASVRHAIDRKKRIDEINRTGGKICTKCKAHKLLDEFSRDSSVWSGYRQRCKSCHNPHYSAINKKWMELNKEHVWWKRKFWSHKITKEKYLEMSASQGGVCAICKGKPLKFLRVDHNHETKKIRGLLCEKCNSGIGFLQDSITICRNAASYLEERGSYYGS